MIAKYLEELLKQKEQLATNLRIKGVEADSSETLNTLIPKILQIQGGSPKRQPVFVAEEVPEKYADTIYTIFQNGIQDLSGYIRNNKPFCNESNGYILNYSQADFGWDGFVCTGSTTPITVDSQTAIAVYPFTGKIKCGCCNKNYRRKTTVTGIVWICSTYNTKGKKYCSKSKQIPEEKLYTACCEVLGLSKFDEGIFQSKIQQIIIPAPNRIKFIFSDNTRKTVEWKDRSRSESWTEDMKKIAGERSKKWHEQSP